MPADVIVPTRPRTLFEYLIGPLRDEISGALPRALTRETTMAASDRNTRRADEAERARHLATSEAAAFATTAGTMLLGLLTGAEAAHNHNEPQPPAASRPPVPPSHPTEAADRTDAGGPSADTRMTGMPTRLRPIECRRSNSTSRRRLQTAHPSALADAPPGDHAGSAQALMSSIPVWTFSTLAHQTPSAGDGTGNHGARRADPAVRCAG